MRSVWKGSITFGLVSIPGPFTARNDGAALDQIKRSLADAFGGYKACGKWVESRFAMAVALDRVLDDGSAKFDFVQFK